MVLRVREMCLTQVYKRGAPPGGGGEVHLSVPVARSLPPISLIEEGGDPFSSTINHKATTAPPIPHALAQEYFP